MFEWLRLWLAEPPQIETDQLVVFTNTPSTSLFFVTYNGFRSKWRFYESAPYREGNWLNRIGGALERDTFYERHFLRHLDKAAQKAIKDFKRRQSRREELDSLWGDELLRERSRQTPTPSEDRFGFSETTTGRRPPEPPPSEVEESEYEDDGGVWRLLTEDG